MTDRYPTGTPDVQFSRQGVDPTSRCLRCGATIAAEGQQRHLEWHRGLTDLLMALQISLGG